MVAAWVGMEEERFDIVPLKVLYSSENIRACTLVEYQALHMLEECRIDVLMLLW